MSDPKLLDARDRINAILTEADIAGVFVLHNAPDNFLMSMHVSPSYSMLSYTREGNINAFTINSDIDDFNGNEEVQLKKLAQTSTLIEGFGFHLRKMGMRFTKLHEIFDAEIKAATEEAATEETDRFHPESTDGH